MADRDDSRDDNFDDVFEQLFDLDSAMDAYDKASKEYLETTKRFLRATDAEEIRHLAKLHDEQQDLVDSFMADLEDTYDFLADGLSDTDAVAYETLVTNRMRDLNAFDRGYRKHLQNLRRDTEIFTDDVETEVEDVFADIKEQVGGLADIANMFNISAIKDALESNIEDATSSMHDLQKSLNLSGSEMEDFKGQLKDVAGELNAAYGGKIGSGDLFSAAQDAIDIGIRNTEDVAEFGKYIAIFKTTTDLQASNIENLVKSIDQYGYDKSVIKDLTDSTLALSSNYEVDAEKVLAGASALEGRINELAGGDQQRYIELEQSAQKAAAMLENGWLNSETIMEDLANSSIQDFYSKYGVLGGSATAAWQKAVQEGDFEGAATELAQSITSMWEQAVETDNQGLQDTLMSTFGISREDLGHLTTTYRDEWDEISAGMDEAIRDSGDTADQLIQEMHKNPFEQVKDWFGMSDWGMDVSSFIEGLNIDLGEIFEGLASGYMAIKGVKAGFNWVKGVKDALTGAKAAAEGAKEAGGFFSGIKNFGQSLFKNFGKGSSATKELAKATEVAGKAGEGTSFFSKLGDAGKSLFGKVKGFGKSAFDFIKGKGGQILEKAPSFIDDVVSRGGKFIGKIASKGGSFLDDIVTKGGSFLSKAGTSVGSYASKAGAVLADWAGPLAVAADAVMGGFQSGEWFKGEEQNGSTVAASAIGGALGGTGPGILDEGSVLDKGLNIGGGALKGAAVGASIGSVIPGLGTAIGAAVGAGVGAVGSAIGGENIAKFFKPVTDGIGDAFNYAIDNIEVGGESLRDHFNEVGAIWADDSKDLLTKIGDTFTWGLDFLGQGLTGIGNWLADVAGGAWDWISGIGQGVGDFFGGIWDWGAGVVNNLWDGFKGENKDLIDNALNNNAHDIANTYGVSAAEAIPSYDVGTPYVAQDQLAMLHQGEAVLTKDENKGLLGNLGAGISGITEIFDTTIGAPMKLVGVREKAGLDLAENFMTVFDKNRQWWSSVFNGNMLGFASNGSNSTTGGTGGTGIIDDSAPSTVTGSQGDFINSIKGGAIQSYKDYGVLPSITLAQAILESGWGKSAIGNNLFGIKAGSGWSGKTQTVPTTEYVNGQPVHITDTFRDYDSIADSVVDHGKFFVENSRYSDMFNYKDYVGQANAIAKAGYATSPTYADSLIQLIKQFNLDQWDPKYAEGTPWVPDDQLALIHRGEMVVPADVNPINNPAPVTPIENAASVPNPEPTVPSALSGLSDDAIRELIRVVSQGIQFIGRKMDEQSTSVNAELYSPAQAVSPMFFGG